MGDTSGRLNRRISVLRFTTVDDGYSVHPGTYAEVGVVWSERKDVSDAERFRSGAEIAEVTSRFVVRWSPFAEAIGPKDRLVCDGRTFDIVGVKEQGRRTLLEISARARVD